MLEPSKTEQERVVAEAATPGGQLRSAREQAKLTVTAVAGELKLTVAYVEALEDDHFEGLPAEPFVLGYLRAYARLLELDAQQLVESYHEYSKALLATEGHLSASSVAPKRASVAVDSGVTNTEQAAPETEVAGKPYAWLIIAAGLLLWVAASLLMSEAPASHVSAPAMAPQLSSVSDVQAPSEFPAQLEASIEPSAEVEAVSVAPHTVDLGLVAEKSLVTADIQLVSNAAAVNNSLAELDSLQLNFIDECWLEVTDSRGDVLNADLYQAGDTITLQGKAPFNVMLGNVRAVNARLNNEVLALNPNGFRKTLRLRIASVGDITVLSGGQAEED